MENATFFNKKRKTKQQVKGDYESYNRTTDYLGVESFKNDTALFLCLPRMGSNLVVKVHYTLGSRKC